MKHFLSPFILILLALPLLLFSCEKETGNHPFEKDILQEGEKYNCEIQMGEQNTKIEFYVNDDTAFLRYTDPESPLYEMEEIVTEEKHLAKFQEITYESASCPGIGNLIFEISEILDEEEPSYVKKEKENTFETYGDNGFSFVITKDKSTGKTKEIAGEYLGQAYKIIFSF